MGMTCDITKTNFKKCSECESKSGVPELCPSCRFNMNIIQMLQNRIDKMVTKDQMIKFLIGEGELLSEHELPSKKATHGSCCCCQTCGHYYDECVCDNNAMLKLIEEL